MAELIETPKVTYAPTSTPTQAPTATPTVMPTPEVEPRDQPATEEPTDAPASDRDLPGDGVAAKQMAALCTLLAGIATYLIF